MPADVAVERFNCIFIIVIGALKSRYRVEKHLPLPQRGDNSLGNRMALVRCGRRFDGG